MNENKPVKHGALWTVLFAVVSLFWIFPIVLVPVSYTHLTLPTTSRV